MINNLLHISKEIITQNTLSIIITTTRKETLVKTEQGLKVVLTIEYDAKVIKTTT